MDMVNLKKKLLYQSTHRGCKELDIILGGFAENFLMDLDDDSVNDYQILLNAPDNDIFNWITQKATPPKKYDTKILRDIISYNRSLYDKSS